MTAEEYLEQREKIITVLYESSTIKQAQLHTTPLQFPEIMRREIMLAFSSGFVEATRKQSKPEHGE